MIVAVASRKASPGVTTLSTLLAAYWPRPDRLRLVIEADASGGTLAARWSAAHGLTWEPGLLALSTTRHPIDGAGDGGGLAEVAQQVAERIWVAAAPPGPDQVSGALGRLGEATLHQLARSEDVVALVDCGRLTAEGSAAALAVAADLTILVCRPRLEEVHALVPAVGELEALGARVVLACVGHEPYPPAEVAANLGLDLIGVLPTDGAAADRYDRLGLGAGRAFERSGLARAAAEIAAVVHRRMGDGRPAPTPTSSDAPASDAPASVAVTDRRPVSGADVLISEPTGPGRAARMGRGVMPTLGRRRSGGRGGGRPESGSGWPQPVPAWQRESSAPPSASSAAHEPATAPVEASSAGHEPATAPVDDQDTGRVGDDGPAATGLAPQAGSDAVDRSAGAPSPAVAAAMAAERDGLRPSPAPPGVVPPEVQP